MTMNVCRHCEMKITTTADKWIHLPADQPAGPEYERSLSHEAIPKSKAKTDATPDR